MFEWSYKVLVPLYLISLVHAAVVTPSIQTTTNLPVPASSPILKSQDPMTGSNINFRIVVAFVAAILLLLLLVFVAMVILVVVIR